MKQLVKVEVKTHFRVDHAAAVRPPAFGAEGVQILNDAPGNATISISTLGRQVHAVII